MTDENQVVVWQADYKPYGEVSVTTATIENNLRFPGQYYDAESGLHYNYFRDYDPKTGRYITSDPIGLIGGLNTYSYSLNNPLRYSDPLGLDVTIRIDRTGSTQSSVNGTINVTSSVTNTTFSGHTIENASPPNPNLPVQPGSYDAFVREDRDPNRIELFDVPGAENIQIHIGNTASDVIGCFAPGTTSGPGYVGNSGDAMDQILNIIRADGSNNITVIVNGQP